MFGMLPAASLPSSYAYLCYRNAVNVQTICTHRFPLGFAYVGTRSVTRPTCQWVISTVVSLNSRTSKEEPCIPQLYPPTCIVAALD